MRRRTLTTALTALALVIAPITVAHATDEDSAQAEETLDHVEDHEHDDGAGEEEPHAEDLHGHDHDEDHEHAFDDVTADDFTGTVYVDSSDADLSSHVNAVGLWWTDVGEGIEPLVEMRAEVEGAWQDWMVVDIDYLEGEERNTEPVMLVGATDIEFRISGDGALPTDARIIVAGSERPGMALRSLSVSPLSTTERIQVGSHSLDVNMRAAWNPAPNRDHPPEYAEVRGVVVHHTANPGSNYTAADVPALMRAMQNYHQTGRGWNDLGYNFVVDKFGRVWEGRGGGIDRAVQGVHATNANSVTTGISFLGNFETERPPAVALDAGTTLMAWKMAQHLVDIDKPIVWSNGHVATHSIVGHRDVYGAATACPGRELHAHLPTMRNTVRSKMAELPAGDHIRNVASSNGSSVIAMTSTGVMEVQIPTTNQPSRLTLGHALAHVWTNIDHISVSPAFNGSDTADIVARHAPTGRLRLYHTDATGNLTTMTLRGGGWNGMQHIITPGDWDGDGLPDILAAERSSGRLWLYPGDGKNGFKPRIQVGTGWQAVKSVTSAGDWDGNGLPDLIALMNNGQVRIYPANGTGRFRTNQVLIPAGHIPIVDIATVSDMYSDGLPDLLATRADGRMVSIEVLPGQTPRVSEPWGAGWQNIRNLTGSGSLNIGERGRLIGINRNTNRLLTYHRPAQQPRVVQAINASIQLSDKVIALGDLTRTGRSDLVSIRADGTMHLHPVAANGTVGASRQIGRGWQNFKQVVAVGDTDGNGFPEILALATNGDLWSYPMVGSSGTYFAPRTLIATGLIGHTIVPTRGLAGQNSMRLLAVNDSTGRTDVYHLRGEAKVRLDRSWNSNLHQYQWLTSTRDLESAGRYSIIGLTADQSWVKFHLDGRGGLSGPVALHETPAAQRLG